MKTKSMKLLRIEVLAVAACFAAFTSPLMAQRGGGYSPKKPATDSISNPFRGTVVSDTAAFISVKGETGQPAAGGGARAAQTAHPTAMHIVSFVIGPDTKILRDGQPITAVQLKRDESVQVTFTAKKGSSIRHATEIQVGNLPTANAPGARKPGR